MMSKIFTGLAAIVFVIPTAVLLGSMVVYLFTFAFMGEPAFDSQTGLRIWSMWAGSALLAFLLAGLAALAADGK